MIPAATASATLAELLERRHSCRGFRPDPVPRTTIDEIVDLSRRTPSWCNTQPWHVTVTEGEETRTLGAALLAYASFGRQDPDIAFPEAYVDAAQDRRRHCAWQLYDAVGIEWGDREASGRQTLENFTLFGAPHLAIITTDAHLGTYGAVDCGLFVQTFLLAATSLGVATVPQAAIAACAPVIRERYRIPADRHVLCGISFGYEDPGHPANGFRTERADREALVDYV